MTSSDPPSGWHSIRPWNAQLSLYVREITSVSVTFTLAVEPTRESDVKPSLAALGYGGAENDDNDDGQGVKAANDEPSTSTKPRSLITEKLANGLRVNVNEANWQRVFIRADEKADEAIIIIYGLMPGRQYDIDLAVVQPGQQQQQHLHRQIMTFEENADPDNTSEHSTDPDSYDHSNASSDAHQTVSTPSTSPSRTIPNTPPPDADATLSSSSSDSDSPPPQITLEERLNQLHHSLSLINAERESLAASLKSARKESQKADAALRSEMEALKRASEKHSAGEVRSRQKVLALQEAVKRAQAATKEDRIKKDKEAEYARVKQESDKVRKARETSVEKDRKRQESMRSELQSLTNKLEKLTAKKDKHETATIPELEQQLSTVEKDIEEQERLLLQMDMNREFEDVSRLVLTSVGQQQQPPASTLLTPYTSVPQHYPYGDHSAYVPVQRTRHSSLGTSGPGPIGRPSHVTVPIAPIQRPTFSSSSSSILLDPRSGSGSSSQNIWTPPQVRHTPNANVTVGRSGSVHYHPQQPQQYRDAAFYPSSSQPQHHDPIVPPMILTSASRRGSLKSGSFGKVPASPISSNSSSSPTPAFNTTASSTSSSAPRRSSLSSTSPPTLHIVTSPNLQVSKAPTPVVPPSPSNGTPSGTISSTLSSTGARI
ncbi:hypothetical protein FA13DRAFT_1797912 [Coprinellus micaceus]|uniref:Uncharacterized protein n=1 Tax=Coprinellus micaceus TaxID=71717 RepID=A0A4Y7SNW4_COPMI|nr:hypothetical protein FA13DRAFT_1797912 [Coprinellus micaceus]